MDAIASEMDIDSKVQKETANASSATESETIEPIVYATVEALPREEALFLSGVDNMSTKDVQAYAEHVGPTKIEWINDTSCNLVFETAEAAREAATSLLDKDDDVSPLSITTLLPAKPCVLGDRTVTGLSLRQSSDEDVKERGAREKSRYYLLYGTDDSDIRSSDRTQDTRSRRRGDVFSRLGQRHDNDDDHYRRRPRYRRSSGSRSRSRSPDGYRPEKDRFGRDRRIRDRRPTSRTRSRSPQRDSSDNASPALTDEDMNQLPERLRGRLGTTS